MGQQKKKKEKSQTSSFELIRLVFLVYFAELCKKLSKCKKNNSFKIDAAIDH